MDGLVAAFNEVRAELVSTLYFLLGNYEDAQDAAQEAFLKCWRAHDSVPEIRNYRAWIYRVAVNAAKDLQRNAWYRRARPLAGAALHRRAAHQVGYRLAPAKPSSPGWNTSTAVPSKLRVSAR